MREDARGRAPVRDDRRPCVRPKRPKRNRETRERRATAAAQPSGSDRNNAARCENDAHAMLPRPLGRQLTRHHRRGRTGGGGQLSDLMSSVNDGEDNGDGGGGSVCDTLSTALDSLRAGDNDNDDDDDGDGDNDGDDDDDDDDAIDDVDDTNGDFR